MKRLATTLALLAVCAAPAFAANPLRISQVYGGGSQGTGTPTYTQDYVEIYNSGNVAVNIGGWALEYGSATGSWGSTALNQFVFPAGTTIQACQYMLIAMTAGTAGAPLPVAPDFSATLTLAAGSGKVALFNALNNNLACGLELAGTLVDKAAYGTANCAEGTAIPLLSTTTGGVRNAAGGTDTDNNLNDFAVVTNPVPRNSSSPKNASCLVTPTRSSTWGSVKSIYR